MRTVEEIEAERIQHRANDLNSILKESSAFREFVERVDRRFEEAKKEFDVRFDETLRCSPAFQEVLKKLEALSNKPSILDWFKGLKR